MDTIFYPGTVVTSEWLNDVNRLNYTVFGNPSTISDVITLLISEGILSSVNEPGTGGGGGVSASATFQTYAFTAIGGETLVALPFSYTLGGKTLFVYINGLLQQPSDHYTETSISSITFNSGLTTGDNIYIVGNVASSAYIPEQAALAAIYALTPVADKFIYFTNGTTAALGTVTSFIRSLMDDADAATARTTLGVSSTIEMNAAITTSSLGEGQDWIDVKASRTINTSYQNTTGKSIMVNISYVDGTMPSLQVSTDNTNWITAAGGGNAGDNRGPVGAVIPKNYYYKLTANSGSLATWAELR